MSIKQKIYCYRLTLLIHIHVWIFFTTIFILHIYFDHIEISFVPENRNFVFTIANKELSHWITFHFFTRLSSSLLSMLGVQMAEHICCSRRKNPLGETWQCIFQNIARSMYFLRVDLNIQKKHQTNELRNCASEENYSEQSGKLRKLMFHRYRKIYPVFYDICEMTTSPAFVFALNDFPLSHNLAVF